MRVGAGGFGVDVQDADVDPLDGLQRPGEVLGEQCCREPEFAVVGELERLLGIGGASHR